MYSFFNDCYSHALAKETSTEEDIAQIHGHIEWLLEMCKDQSLSPRQLDAVVWHGVDLLRPRTTLGFFPWSDEERARCIQTRTYEADYWQKSPLERYKPRMERSRLLTYNHARRAYDGPSPVPAKHFADWAKFASEGCLSPSRLVELNRSPIEYVAVQEEREDRWTFGQMFHKCMPFAYYLSDRCDWARHLLSAIFERTGMEWRRSDLSLAFDMARSFLACFLAKIVQVSDEKGGKMGDDARGASGDDTMHKTVDESRGKGGDDVWQLDVSSVQRATDNWIFFEGQLGPRRWHRWTMYAEPDCIVCYRGTVYVAEWKTVPELSWELRYYEDRSYKTRALFPRIQETHGALANVMLAVCHRLLDRFDSIVTMILVPDASNRPRLLIQPNSMNERIAKSIDPVLAREWTEQTVTWSWQK